MNNIQENDWASDSWGAYSGMGNNSDYSIVDGPEDEILKDAAEDATERPLES